MPRISEFFGIAIYMYYKEHVPPPRRAQSLVFEWAARYQNELRANWELARAGQPLQRIPPLD